MQALTQTQLASRWHKSPRTLEQWRWLGKGPRYIKIGARVIYPLEFVEAYEKDHIHVSTLGPVRRRDR
ncbi:DNA-binding protein [Tropicimonas sp. IMCC6043]|uniref:DNA-binding protein n=1 Tax=Tropicimonas sp. IMCC6043 TaxID=2510645 RepID=UPI00101C8A26|nr:DNA-binding protein [Tropicimonas sp. IMCC6043]RYH08462.1 DNA-binding protein [Tropicimonas sp. IMCC6043]